MGQSESAEWAELSAQQIIGHTCELEIVVRMCGVMLQELSAQQIITCELEVVVRVCGVMLQRTLSTAMASEVQKLRGAPAHEVEDSALDSC